LKFLGNLALIIHKITGEIIRHKVQPFQFSEIVQIINKIMLNVNNFTMTSYNHNGTSISLLIIFVNFGDFRKELEVFI